MIERAARCIESAGEHILQGCAAHIRTRHILHSNFWRHGALDIDIPLWCLSLMQSPHQSLLEVHSLVRDRSTLPSTAASRPFLEFLYPPRTRSFARYYNRNSDNNSSLRRRRKLGTRGYASSAEQDFDQTSGRRAENSSTVRANNTSEGEPSTGAGSEATVFGTLRKLLDAKDHQDCDQAWNLYQLGGRPPEHASELLNYISNSDAPVDADRARLIFDSIPVDSRVSRDYWCATKTAVRTGGSFDELTDLCKEATSRQEGGQCWGLVIAICINRTDWNQALNLWKIQALSNGDAGPAKSAELLGFDELPQRLFALIDAIASHKLSLNQPGVADLTTYIFRHVVSKDKTLMRMSLSSVLELFQRLGALQLIDSRHYFEATTTLLSSPARSALVRSILIYRNLRWKMPGESPPDGILQRFLSRLCHHRISGSVEYFLEEFRYFRQTPPETAYQTALTTFARLGNVSTVERLFQRLVEDYGPPSDQRSLSPLLYVHARVGQVDKTKAQFERLEREFSVTPNVVCWNMLLTAHAKAGQLEGAMSTFTEMRRVGISMDSHSYGIILGLLAKRGDVNAVEKMVDAARRDKVAFTSPMIDTVIEVLCRSSRYGDALQVARKALSITPPLNLTRSWNILLWNHAFMADADAVSSIQNEMQESGVQFDSMTYAALMLSLVLIGDTDSVSRILRKLHYSGDIRVNEFHYTILMHGYYREQNRDMVHVLYKEMTERFRNPGPSANLFKLGDLIRRDMRRFDEKGNAGGEQPRLDLSHAEQFLDSIMEQFDVSNYATSKPQPGSQRRQLRDAFPSTYYELIISAYGSKGALQRAKELFGQYTEKAKELSNPKAPPLRLLSVLMTNHLRQDQHKQVESCWNTALQQIVRLATPTDVNPLLSSSRRENPPSDVETPTILRYHRYSLSYCLSIYLKSLSAQNLWSKISNVINEIESIGFVLTTADWSLYVKLLCLSQDPANQLVAFTIFEEKYVDNFPGWHNIRHGLAKRPEDAPPGLDLHDRTSRTYPNPGTISKSARRVWKNIRPDYMQPTYITMMHLASSLVDFQMRAVTDGGKEMRTLLSKAPKTVDALATVPYLKDKFQGILLRGRTQEPDPEPSKEIDMSRHTVRTGGLLGVDDEVRIDTRPADETLEGEEAQDFEEVSEELPPEEFVDSSAEADNASYLLPEGSGDWSGHDPLNDELPEARDRVPYDPTQLPKTTSEPDPETLKSLFAEDAQSRQQMRGRGAEGEEEGEDLYFRSTLDAQDEQDLEYQSQLAERQREEAGYQPDKDETEY